MQLIVEPNGRIRGLYGEEIDLAALGTVNIRRASQVEPTANGGWTADLGPVGGPVLGPYALRSAALAAEVHWFEEQMLTRLA